MSRISSYGNVRNVQRGTIAIAYAATSNTATITAVDMSKTLLNFLGWEVGSGGTSEPVRLALTNSTTVTATGHPTTGHTITVSYEVIEFY